MVEKSAKKKKKKAKHKAKSLPDVAAGSRSMDQALRELRIMQASPIVM